MTAFHFLETFWNLCFFLQIGEWKALANSHIRFALARQIKLVRVLSVSSLPFLMTNVTCHFSFISGESSGWTATFLQTQQTNMLMPSTKIIKTQRKATHSCTAITELYLYAKAMFHIPVTARNLGYRHTDNKNRIKIDFIYECTYQ